MLDIVRMLAFDYVPEQRGPESKARSIILPRRPYLCITFDAPRISVAKIFRFPWVERKDSYTPPQEDARLIKADHPWSFRPDKCSVS